MALLSVVVGESAVGDPVGIIRRYPNAPAAARHSIFAEPNPASRSSASRSAPVSAAIRPRRFLMTRQALQDLVSLQEWFQRQSIVAFLVTSGIDERDFPFSLRFVKATPDLFLALQPGEISPQELLPALRFMPKPAGKLLAGRDLLQPEVEAACLLLQAPRPKCAHRPWNQADRKPASLENAKLLSSCPPGPARFRSHNCPISPSRLSVHPSPPMAACKHCLYPNTRIGIITTSG